MSLKQKNKEIMLKNKNDLKELEQSYIDNEIAKLPSYVEKQKEIITNEIIKYVDEHQEPILNQFGTVVGTRTKLSPLVITNYFFKPITNLTCVEPIYSAEQLGIVFDYYCFIIAKINDEIGYFPSSLTSFCKLAGITLNSLRNLRNSVDYNMRVVVEKIYDQVGDENITMSQMGMVKERTTMFKMKSQNELVEKEQPKVNIHITEKPDFDQIQERLNKYKQFARKKEK